MPLRLGRALCLLQALLVLTACRSLPIDSSRTTPELGASVDPALSQSALLPTPPSASVPLPARPYPPAVTEFTPGSGAVVGSDALLTWEFSEPMNRQSVVAGFQIEPETTGDLVWSGDQALTFHPADLVAGTRYQVRLAGDVQSAAGLPLSGNLTFSFSTLPPLKVVRVSPGDGEGEVRPDTPIRVTFNRPVVGHGCVDAVTPVDGDCPQPLLSISPDVAVRGSWLHTTVYQYEAPDGFSAGATHQVTLRAGLEALDGAILDEPTSWAFITASPRIVAQSPAPGQSDVPLTAAIQITFSTPMDRVFTGRAFSLVSEDGAAVAGTLVWEQGAAALVFTPAERLALGTTYRVYLGERARAALSTPLENPQLWEFRTVPYPNLVAQIPVRGERGVAVNAPVHLTLEGAIDEPSLADGIEILPDPGEFQRYAVFDRDSGVYTLIWPREPRTEYCVTLKGVAQAEVEGAAQAETGIADIYGHPLVSPEPICFTTGDLPPRLDFAGQEGGGTLDVRRPSAVHFLARNVSRMDLVLVRSSLTSLMQRRYDEGGVQRQWREPLNTELNASTLVTVPLTGSGGALPTGLYSLSWQVPGSDLGKQAIALAIVDLHLTVKLSMQEGLVWVTSLETGLPVSRVAVQLVDEEGLLIAGGTTDEDGLAYISTKNLQGLSRPIAVVVGEAGEPGFGFVLLSWQGEASPAEFGLETGSGLRLPYRVFVETDGAAYRAGDRVEIAGWVRQEDGGRFAVPGAEAVLALQLRDPDWQTVYSRTVRTTETGSFKASLLLAQDAAPGVYRLEVLSSEPLPGHGDAALLAVKPLTVMDSAEPAIGLTVAAEERDVMEGDTVRYAVDLHTLRRGNSADLEVTWRVIAEPYNLSERSPDGGAGGWSWSPMPSATLPPGQVIVREGQADASPDGRIWIEFPASWVDLGEGAGAAAQRWILEATVFDESGTPAIASDEAIVHRSLFYTGVRPRARVVSARERVMVDLLTMDLSGQPVGAQALTVRLSRRLWQQAAGAGGAWGTTDLLMTEQAVTTDTEGAASVGFTVVQTGTYVVETQAVDADGRTVRSAVEFWVSGSEAAAWRSGDLQLRLLADAASTSPCAETFYRAGDIARVLVPTTLAGPYQILVTIEREGILDVERYSMDRPNPILSVPIEAAYAPSVYISVVAVRPRTESEPAQVQAGYSRLCVDPAPQRLAVRVSADRETYEPGDTANLVIETTDSAGKPVDAEVLVSMGKHSSSRSLWDAFYGDRPLAVRMSDTLLASTDRRARALAELADHLTMPRSAGAEGGQDGSAPMAQDAAGMAFWSGPLNTGTDGRLELPVILPASLETWHVEVRAITASTEVGDAELRIEVTQPLSVRAVTPRSVVTGDQTHLTAAVRNTTPEELLAEVWLETGEGLTLVSAEAQQRVIVPPGGQRYVSWTVDVGEGQGDVAYANFGARSGDYESVVAAGIPVRRLWARDGPRIAGLLGESATQVEILVLPEWATGESRLTVGIEPAPAAALDMLLIPPEGPTIDTVDEWVSWLLPVAASYAALERSTGTPQEPLAVPRATTAYSVGHALEQVYARQNPDGGWAWGPAESDLLVTSYAVHGLLRVEDAGFPVSSEVLEAGLRCVGGVLEHGMSAETRTPHAALALYVLSEAGTPWPQGAAARLYGERALLGTADTAFLALALGTVDPSDPRVRTLLSELNATAVRSDAGATWMLTNRSGWATQRQVTAVVMMALARLAPHDPLLPEVARWLVLNRGLAPEGSAYERAWTSTALSDYLEAVDHEANVSEWHVALNGTLLGAGDPEEAAVAGAWSPSVDLVAKADLLQHGHNIIELSRGAGAGELYYNLRLDPVLSLGLHARRSSGEARGIVLDRRYCQVDPSADQLSAPDSQPCQRVDAVRVGDLVEVRLTLSVPETRQFVVLEDPYPAGFDPIGFVDVSFPALPSRNFDRQDLHEMHARYAARDLPAGTYEVAYRLRATLPGVYWVLPGFAEARYFPEIWGRTGIDSIAVYEDLD